MNFLIKINDKRQEVGKGCSKVVPKGEGKKVEIPELS